MRRAEKRHLDDHVLIGIGASAGGIEALTRLLPELPVGLPAAILVVLHLGRGPGAGGLPRILSRAGLLPAAFAQDGDHIEIGRILVAPPDRHLVVQDGVVRLLDTPRENGARPAIDPLFRSGAREHGSRFVAVVLSGALDDGSAGLVAVRRRGGLAVIQDPEDALFAGMPRNALETAGADHRVSLAAMGPLLVQLARGGRDDRMTSPRRLRLSPAEGGRPGHPPGAPSPFSCPDCGGVLWESKADGVTRLECRTGHAYGPISLASSQDDSVDAALWAAIRALEERSALARRLEERARARGALPTATRFGDRAQETEERVRVLRNLVGSPLPEFPASGSEEPDTRPRERGTQRGTMKRGHGPSAGARRRRA
jgi:two-component system chemotaxis response regulator CheB